MHSKQPGFTYSACGSFNKNKERIQKFKETWGSKHIYRNELDKAWFQHDMAYGGFKDLSRRTNSDKVLKNKAFNIAKNRKYDGYQRGLTSIVYKFFGKNTSSGAIKSMPNHQIVTEHHKPIIKTILEKYILHLKTIFGVLIFQICN